MCRCCTTAGRSRRSARRQLTPAYLPESGRDAPKAFEATGTSSDVAFAASGSDADVVETVLLPPVQEKQATLRRCYECCSVLGYHTVARDPATARARAAARATCPSMDGPCRMVQRSMLHACCKLHRFTHCAGAVSGLWASYAAGRYCLYMAHGTLRVTARRLYRRRTAAARQRDRSRPGAR